MCVNTEINIIYQDEFLIAVNKPAKLLVHRTKIDKYESLNAMHLLRDKLSRWVYPVHRLDKATSGVLIFALSSEIAAKMTELFTNRLVNKYYLAVARGFVKEYEKISYPLKEIYDKKNDKRTKLNKLPQEAVTEYKCIAKAELPFAIGRYNTARYSLLAVKPITGRQRQIRRHLKHISHHLIGDVRYGDGKHNKFFKEYFLCNRILLHSYIIKFKHPYTQKNMSIIAGLDSIYAHILQNVFKLKLNNEKQLLVSESYFS